MQSDAIWRQHKAAAEVRPSVGVVAALRGRYAMHSGRPVPLRRLNWLSEKAAGHAPHLAPRPPRDVSRKFYSNSRGKKRAPPLCRSSSSHHCTRGLPPVILHTLAGVLSVDEQSISARTNPQGWSRGVRETQDTRNLDLRSSDITFTRCMDRSGVVN